MSREGRGGIMKLAEMTVDEAIALTHQGIPGLRWDPDSVPHIEAMGLDDDARLPLLRALWFDAAWEWLKKSDLDFDVCFGPGWYLWDFHCESEIRGDWCGATGLPDFYPTKYHALAAACLLAAGKSVP